MTPDRRNQLRKLNDFDLKRKHDNMLKRIPQTCYLHGTGSVRPTHLSRYRQWMTHKLATWIDPHW